MIWLCKGRVLLYKFYSTISFADFLLIEFGSQWEGTPFPTLSWEKTMLTDYEYSWLSSLDPTSVRPEPGCIMAAGDFDQTPSFWTSGNIPPSYSSLQRPAHI